ncbi:CRISPR-associated endonuclease Cas2 [Thermosipho atlanticus]|uniref:CRISPR-associated endoribonuclease Cas2 n=1 Tax=Thermosipho atlanticus DSM 15807 TaxID=1123380 RepID=A0A1M5U456_9BACT|nr:CRISPR-associated endonuclease Cas2 [Thermosipho atlanticus]SHH57650.1 CRISPR-associated protein Cas2 [Thermosipho atlanticus DSM 15807]
MYVILIYDINTEKNQKVLSKVFKICKKYLFHVQKSVFEGELTKSQLFKLKKELENTIRKDVDSIIIFKSRNEKWLSKDFLGKSETSTDNLL